jgi:5-methylcytosine-specific restriction protein A
MEKRQFRSDESVAAELATRSRVESLLERHGFSVTGREWIERGIAITQVIEATRGDGPPIRMHVRLCWRRDGRNRSEDLYAAAQLRARLDDDDWDLTLSNIAARHVREGYTHLLMVQDSAEGFMFAALIPSAEIPAIWARQREVSGELIRRGLTGKMTKNHAANGSSPTLWLQDDRHPATPAVAQVLWEWPGVVNVLALPVAGGEVDTDTLDDLPGGDIGRDGAERERTERSGYPRDPAVRAAVRARADGRCEREGCGEHRDYPGFLDVHHILGVEVSDRVWTCVALCPNCHREAHFAPDRDAINAALAAFAIRFRDEPVVRRRVSRAPTASGMAAR